MKHKSSGNFILLFILIILLVFTIQLNAAEYYIAPDGAYLNDGTMESPWSLVRANAYLKPGDTAILLDGTYTSTPIAPDRSGEENNHIVYKAANPHMAVFQEVVELPDSRGPVAIFVNSKSYITVDGIKVFGVKRWVMGVSSHHITIANGHFENGSGWINCRFEENGDGIHIKNNYFHGGTDLVSLDGGDGHLVEDNFFGDASHTGLVFLGVQKSVVRNNFLTNRLWRCMEVESQRHEPYRLSPDSPCIDAGGPLTTTVSAGQGTVVEVQDALYFTDGYDLVDADIICVDSERVTIVEVDYEANELTLDREISWTAEADVALDYEGEGPDMGAVEYSDLQTGWRQDDHIKRPGSFNLYQNFPNPFNPTTIIIYELPARSAGGQITNYVDLSICNILGEKVATLVDQKQAAGLYQVEWNANGFASGIYYYQLRTDGDYIHTKKLVLLK